MDDSHLSKKLTLPQRLEDRPSNLVATQEGAEIDFAACAVNKDNPQPHAGQGFRSDHTPWNRRAEVLVELDLQEVLTSGTSTYRTRAISAP